MNFGSVFLQLSIAIGVTFSLCANASIDPSLELKIKNACVSSGQTKNIKDLSQVCACVASNHFDSALNEPDELVALKQLIWVIEYYQEKNQSKLKEIISRPENLVEFDLDIINQCLETVRGK